MTISTTARHCTLEPDDKQVAHSRLERIGRFLREKDRAALGIHLVVTGIKTGHHAEITLRVHRHELVAREDAADARSAIELAADQIEHQIRRLKDRSAARRKGDRLRTADGIGVIPPSEESLDDVFEDRAGGE